MASALLTKEVAEEAIELVLPAIETLMSTRAKRHDFHIVILDPTKPPWECFSFVEAILHECSLGDVDQWEHDYKAVARSKAEQSWRTSLPNILVQMLAPALIKSGDTKYWSSFVWQGLIVGCSGIQPWFDFLISGWIALACQQLCRDEAEAVFADDDRSFF